jgi:Glycosyltransferase like family
MSRHFQGHHGAGIDHYAERMTRREPVSLICVWNDEAVRASCLDASVRALLATAPETEYLPVDNREQTHTSAGSALNHGVRSARHDYVAFVHQDVHLHSLEALERAAGLLADDPGLGLLGPVGITSTGEVVGRIRDRVLLLGEAASTPVDVDSLDEVLFLARRDSLLADPITEHPDLAWHAYAVELGMRQRAAGLRVAAVDIPLTHNSLTINLARLDHAHAALAGMYPDQVPTRTTCGDITSTTPKSESRPLLANHRWRLRWLRSSLAARRAVGATGGTPHVVLADIRFDVDEVLARTQTPSLRILNVVGDSPEFPDLPGGTRLPRRDAEVVCGTIAASALGDARLGDVPTLLTGLGLAELSRVAMGPDDVIGVHESLGYWLLMGVPGVAGTWTSARARPARLLV